MWSSEMRIINRAWVYKTRTKVMITHMQKASFTCKDWGWSVLLNCSCLFNFHLVPKINWGILPFVLRFETLEIHVILTLSWFLGSYSLIKSNFSWEHYFHFSLSPFFPEKCYFFQNKSMKCIMFHVFLVYI